MEEQSKGKVIGGIILAIILSSVVLFWLAKGTSYNLTVTDPVKGAENGVVFIEEFSDFQCPACKQNAPLIAGALKEFPTQVKFVYRDFPLSIHNQARGAASAALCAGQQGKYYEYHDLLFENQDAWSSPSVVSPDGLFETYAGQLELNLEDWNSCRDSRDVRQAVQSDVDEGFERGVNSTPTFFMNGTKIESNPTSVFAWIKLIEAELERQGIAPETADAMVGGESSAMDQDLAE